MPSHRGETGPRWMYGEKEPKNSKHHQQRKLLRCCLLGDFPEGIPMSCLLKKVCICTHTFMCMHAHMGKELQLLLHKWRTRDGNVLSLLPHLSFCPFLLYKGRRNSFSGLVFHFHSSLCPSNFLRDLVF